MDTPAWKLRAVTTILWTDHLWMSSERLPEARKRSVCCVLNNYGYRPCKAVISANFQLFSDSTLKQYPIEFIWPWTVWDLVQMWHLFNWFSNLKAGNSLYWGSRRILSQIYSVLWARVVVRASNKRLQIFNLSKFPQSFVFSVFFWIDYDTKFNAPQDVWLYKEAVILTTVSFHPSQYFSACFNNWICLGLEELIDKL